jgi:hypothetical protein
VWPPGELIEQIRLTRAANAGGDIHFSMRSLMPATGVRRDSVLVGVATQPPTQSRAAVLADSLRSQLYAEPALIPASPWLSRVKPAPPKVRLTVDASSRAQVLHLTPGDAARVAWWTVRVFDGNTWKTSILPGTQRMLTVGAPGATPPIRVVVTAVNRFGNESPARK